MALGNIQLCSVDRSNRAENEFTVTIYSDDQSKRATFDCGGEYRAVTLRDAIRANALRLRSVFDSNRDTPVRPAVTFPQDAVVVNEAGQRFRVIVGPDRLRISTRHTSGELEGITSKIPAYALRLDGPFGPEGDTIYVEQPKAEKEFRLAK